MKSKRPERTLALESGSGYQIKDETGAVVSVEEAKRRYEAREVDDCNMAFARLIHMGFDVEAVKAYYLKDSRNRATTNAAPERAARQQPKKDKLL